MKHLLNHEVAQELQDVLNECEECFGTLNQHMIMCSNRAHQAIAYILSNWDWEEISDYEREDFEEKIQELESDIFMRETDIYQLESKVHDLQEKLRVWSAIDPQTGKKGGGGYPC